MKAGLANVSIVCGIALWVPRAMATDTRDVIQGAPASALVSAPGAEIRASKEAAVVAIKLSKTTDYIPPTSADGTSATFSTFSLSAEAPLKKGESDHALASSTGWGNATVLGLSYIRYVTPWSHTKTSSKSVAARARLCDELKAAAKKKGVADDAFECKLEQFDPLLPERAKEAAALFGGATGTTWLWGVTANYGFQDSTYHEATTLAEIKQRNKPHAVGIVGGLNPAEGAFLLLKLERKTSYKDDDAVIRCLASASVVLTCANGAMKAPQRSVGNIAEIEYRQLFSDGKYAASLIVSRDTSAGKTEVQVPIYFLGDGDAVVNGGVRLGWNSLDRKGVLSVFVGAPFKLWR